jgi:hypothetical protein
MEKAVLEPFIAPQSRFNPELKGRLLTKLGLSAPRTNTPSLTNSTAPKF